MMNAFLFSAPLKKMILSSVICFIAMNSFSQPNKGFLSAKDSDPIKMGWMQGFPPPKDKIVEIIPTISNK
jgi:hypothetical protein